MAYAVIRHYKGSAELIDELGRRAGEVENVIRGVSGFQDYYLVVPTTAASASVCSRTGPAPRSREGRPAVHPGHCCEPGR